MYRKRLYQEYAKCLVHLEDYLRYNKVDRQRATLCSELLEAMQLRRCQMTRSIERVSGNFCGRYFAKNVSSIFILALFLLYSFLIPSFFFLYLLNITCLSQIVINASPGAPPGFKVGQAKRNFLWFCLPFIFLPILTLHFLQNPRVVTSTPAHPLVTPLCIGYF